MSAEDLRMDGFAECPGCGAEWGYEVDGKRYSHLIGNVWNDRIQQWNCPGCSLSWPRGGVRWDR